MDREIWHLDGQAVEVTHLKKLFWPEDGITKGELLAYYRAMGATLLPYFRHRPVTLHLFPDGIHGTSFYRRDLPEDAPAWIHYVDYWPETVSRTIQVPIIDNLASLIWLANRGSIEFHLWGSRLPHLTEPDVAFFDLDPGDAVSFERVLEAALHVYDFLTALGIEGFVKTSGGRGVHVYVPLSPGHTFEQVRRWVKQAAQILAKRYPLLMAVAHGATHEEPVVTIDYAQNSMGRNMAAPYTVRAHPGAPVSTPLTWEEVREGRIRPSDFTLRTVPERVMRYGDPFRTLFSHRQRLPELM